MMRAFRDGIPAGKLQMPERSSLWLTGFGFVWREPEEIVPQTVLKGT
jgi:hypothetical protein